MEVQHVLKQHANRAVDKTNNQRVNVRRRELLQDAFRQFKRTSFDVTKMLRITFLGESAVDGGGPCREFFRLLLADLFTVSGLFVGYPSSVTAAHNVVSLENGDFAIAAKVVVTSIVQGGLAPHCFSAAIADFIVYGEVRSPVNLNDIADSDVREKMKKVHIMAYTYFCSCVRIYIDYIIPFQTLFAYA